MGREGRALIDSIMSLRVRRVLLGYGGLTKYTNVGQVWVATREESFIHMRTAKRETPHHSQGELPMLVLIVIETTFYVDQKCSTDLTSVAHFGAQAAVKPLITHTQPIPLGGRS